MSDDIVKMLRSARKVTQFNSAGQMTEFDGQPTDRELLAADEIERLRKEMKRIKDKLGDVFTETDELYQSMDEV